MKSIKLPELKCPICDAIMKTRIKSGEHINKSTKRLSKHSYHQYFCEKCDDEDSGWTTTTSDTLSLKIKK